MLRSRYIMILSVAPALMAGIARADSIDLTTSGAAAQTGDGGIVIQGSGGGAAGSGTFPYFYKVQGAHSTEAGVNDPGKPLDTKDVASTSLRLGGLVSAGDYYELALDVNENVDNIIFLDSVQIYLSSSSNPADLKDTDVAPYAKLGTLVYDLGSKSVELNYSLEAGSGKADMLLYVPKSRFSDVISADASLGADPYVYLYSSFSQSDAGFEEWGQRDAGSAAPSDPVSFLPPLPGADTSVPLPAAVWGGMGLLGLLGAVRRFRQGC